MLNVYTCEKSDSGNLSDLYGKVSDEQTGGGTDIYKAADYALKLISENYKAEDYTAAVILMTDGNSSQSSKNNFENNYRQSGSDIPFFSIMFGEAQSGQFEGIAQLTNARVFDGRKDLIGAFRSVKEYN